MKRRSLFLLALPALLAACSSVDRETIAHLRGVRIDIREEKLEGGLEKAMASYRRFLEMTPDSALAPEAMRRLADLKVEREYGLVAGGGAPADRSPSPDPAIPAPTPASARQPVSPAPPAADGESESEFEKRTTGVSPVAGAAIDTAGLPAGADDLERAGALEAIELYKKLLREYPLYERNDQVLYQMSRAYEELGRIEEAMAVMDELIGRYPNSRYLDEVQFRRAEYFFAHRRYLEAEEAYGAIAAIGVGSYFYELALYKLGWTFYKQELYDEALHKFVAVLDHKVATGFDFARTEDEIERKRLEDTFRVISLSFSNLGGADSAVDYFARHGSRTYEDGIYKNLGEFYFDKRRYADAVATYSAFVGRNPFHRVSPAFHMRIIEIHMAGGFPTLVLEAKKAFAATYSLAADYWRHFEPGERPEVLGYLKTNLTDLANHYHALFQDPQRAKEKPENFAEALHWYRAFLDSFPAAGESPAVHHRLADLLLENRSFAKAAVEYEKTAYAYPPHDQSASAGYAAVYAHREHLGTVAAAEKDAVKREVVRSSLQFAATFPEHEKAAVVLGAAADDLYALRDFEPALGAGRKLIEAFPGADAEVRRSAWLVVAHAAYELQRYGEAETAYATVLELLPAADQSRAGLVDNLAAAIYQQGDQANRLADYRGAADHFRRVGRLAPTSAIRPTAEYDAAAALIRLQAWEEAAAVLAGFRRDFPGHQLQPEVTKKIAYVYRQDGRLGLAAEEYERIERESPDDEVRREALQVAAQLHAEAGNSARALAVYRRYVDAFPQPVELNLETRSKIAAMLKTQDDRPAYLDELRQIVAIEGKAGVARSARTRHLAAHAALVLAEVTYERFRAIQLVKPFEANLRQKRDLMKAATQECSRLLEYEVGEVTAAATFYLAEIYGHFSQALLASERPEGLSPLELEQYELAIEEQAYPFEEKAIAVHGKNLELMAVGVYNAWIDRSLEKLAALVPARYAKAEEGSGPVRSVETFVFEVPRPEPVALPAAEEAAAPVRIAEEQAEEKLSADSGDLPPEAEPAAAEVPEEGDSRAGERE